MCGRVHGTCLFFSETLRFRAVLQAAAAAAAAAAVEAAKEEKSSSDDDAADKKDGLGAKSAGGKDTAIKAEADGTKAAVDTVDKVRGCRRFRSVLPVALSARRCGLYLQLCDSQLVRRRRPQAEEMEVDSSGTPADAPAKAAVFLGRALRHSQKRLAADGGGRGPLQVQVLPNGLAAASASAMENPCCSCELTAT